MHVYEVRLRKDHRGVELISDVPPLGRLRYGEANAKSSTGHWLSLVERLVREQAEALRKAGLEAGREGDSTFARFSRYPYVEYPNHSYGRPLCLGRTNN